MYAWSPALKRRGAHGEVVKTHTWQEEIPGGDRRRGIWARRPWDHRRDLLPTCNQALGAKHFEHRCKSARPCGGGGRLCPRGPTRLPTRVASSPEGGAPHSTLRLLRVCLLGAGGRAVARGPCREELMSSQLPQLLQPSAQHSVLPGESRLCQPHPAMGGGKCGWGISM